MLVVRQFVSKCLFEAVALSSSASRRGTLFLSFRIRKSVFGSGLRLRGGPGLVRSARGSTRRHPECSIECHAHFGSARVVGVVKEGVLLRRRGFMVSARSAQFPGPQAGTGWAGDGQRPTGIAHNSWVGLRPRSSPGVGSWWGKCCWLWPWRRGGVRLVRRTAWGLAYWSRFLFLGGECHSVGRRARSRRCAVAGKLSN